MAFDVAVLDGISHTDCDRVIIVNLVKFKFPDKFWPIIMKIKYLTIIIIINFKKETLKFVEFWWFLLNIKQLKIKTICLNFKIII